MHKALLYKTKQFFFVLIKLSIVVGAFYFIYNKLTTNNELDFDDFSQFLIKNHRFSLISVCFLLFLSIFNWFFEILKWQVLINSFKTITFKNALEQCLSSLTASLLTPNRVGEYGVKALYFQPQERKKVIVLNLLGNGLQMLVTLLVGIVGLSLFISEYTIDVDYYQIARWTIIIFISIVFISFAISKKPITVKGVTLEKIKKYFRNLPKTTYALTFLFALIRYGIFSFQFYYLLYLFDVNISYFDSMILITSMYVLASVIPSIFIFDVVIKGSVAVYLFSFVGMNTISILSIVTLMWLLNVVLPSMFGSLFVMKFKIPKSIL